MAGLPHHHHGVAACLETQRCDGWEAVGEGIPGHLLCKHDFESHAPENTGHPNGCVVKNLYVSGPVRENSHCDSLCDSDWHTHLFPLGCFYAEIIPARPETGIDTGYREPVFGYQSVDAQHVLTLRGPPTFLC